MTQKKTLELFIKHDSEGSYFTLPFTMPPDTESLTLSYFYKRHLEDESQAASGTFTARQEINIVDLGIIAPDGSQVGTSGSDKTEIFLSAVSATPGYKPCPLEAGEWQIIVGAYKIAEAGVAVTYELTFIKKHLRLLKGDLHTHTVASDGVLTAKELAKHALRHGLDFLAVTDHNQLVSANSLPHISGITLIPGVEWTHYEGHANFLGVDQPYDTPFVANTPQEVQRRFQSARDRGALIVINHPQDDTCSFKFDMQTLPYDCFEVWNGPFRESNMRALGLWQSMLSAGKKIPIVGGSDYHRDNLFQILGGPTTCVYAMSSSPADILAALRSGHSFITFAPNGPTLQLSAGDKIMGDTVTWAEVNTIQISVTGLVTGDVIRVVSAEGSEPIFEAPSAGSFVQTDYQVKQPGFVRVEILRAFLPGIPLLPAILSNPIYFDG